MLVKESRDSMPFKKQIRLIILLQIELGRASSSSSGRPAFFRAIFSIARAFSFLTSRMLTSEPWSDWSSSSGERKKILLTNNVDRTGLNTLQTQLCLFVNHDLRWLRLPAPVFPLSISCQTLCPEAPGSPCLWHWKKARHRSWASRWGGQRNQDPHHSPPIWVCAWSRLCWCALGWRWPANHDKRFGRDSSYLYQNETFWMWV